MQLLIKSEFTLEVLDEKYTGTLSDLTKAQSKTFDNGYKNERKKAKDLTKFSKKVDKQTRKILIAEKREDWDKVEALEIELDKLELKLDKDTQDLEESTHIEEMFKDRLKTSITSNDKEAILQAGETYGYEKVLQTIMKDIRESSAKNS